MRKTTKKSTQRSYHQSFETASFTSIPDQFKLATSSCSQSEITEPVDIIFVIGCIISQTNDNLTNKNIDRKLKIDCLLKRTDGKKFDKKCSLSHH